MNAMIKLYCKASTLQYKLLSLNKRYKTGIRFYSHSCPKAVQTFHGQPQIETPW